MLRVGPPRLIGGRAQRFGQRSVRIIRPAAFAGRVTIRRTLKQYRDRLAATGFEIQESPADDWLRLTVLGELDLATAPLLQARLEELRSDQRAVVMDLSRVEFIDSTGLAILVQAITSTSTDGWRFAIDSDLSPQARRLFRLTTMDQFLTDEQARHK